MTWKNQKQKMSGQDWGFKQQNWGLNQQENDVSDETQDFNMFNSTNGIVEFQQLYI